MPLPSQPTVFEHLLAAQRATTVGLHRLLRREGPVSPRTVYRWRRALGDKLLVVPNVSVEALGLVHAHVFVHERQGIECRHAVEAALVTRDFCSETLYLHCLVPARQVSRFRASVPGATIVWSSSGWQQFLTSDEEILLPSLSEPVSESSLLRSCPFIVPSLMEAWTPPNSLPAAWARIQERLGPRLREFLPRGKIHRVNGKNHVSAAFERLRAEGLIRQHIVRYHPLLATSVEVFVHARLARAPLTGVLEGLRHSLHAIESYPTREGFWCRLLGPHRLLDAILALPAVTREQFSHFYFHTKRHPTPLVRYAYEHPECALVNV